MEDEGAASPVDPTAREEEVVDEVATNEEVEVEVVVEDED